MPSPDENLSAAQAADELEVEHLMTEQDREDLAQLQEESAGVPAITHTVLEAWERILSEAHKLRDATIKPSEVLGVIERHPRLSIKDVPAFLDKYYQLISGAHAIVEAEIATDSDCLHHVADDAEYNRAHYFNIVSQWVAHFALAEREWQMDSEFAEAELWAIVAAASAVQGRDSGVINWLSAIHLSLTEEEFEELQDLGTELAESAPIEEGEHE